MADVLPANSRLDHMEMAYAKEVIDYNNRVIQGVVRPQLVRKFANAAESFNNLVHKVYDLISYNLILILIFLELSCFVLCFQKVNELWEIVGYMSDISPQFKDSPLLTRTSSPTKSQLILQARKYLEER